MINTFLIDVKIFNKGKILKIIFVCRGKMTRL